jgi:hypothetical protein
VSVGGCFRSAIVSIGLPNSELEFIGLASVSAMGGSVSNSDDITLEPACCCYRNASNFCKMGTMFSIILLTPGMCLPENWKIIQRNETVIIGNMEREISLSYFQGYGTY